MTVRLAAVALVAIASISIEAHSFGGGGSTFSSPVHGGSCVIFSEFAKTNPFTRARFNHGAYDLAPLNGTTLYVRPAASGTVTMVGYESGCGNFVEIMHGPNLYTMYCHMRTRAPVRVNQEVSTSTSLGIVGSTGRSSGPHLHFQVKNGPGWQARAIDPIPSLMARKDLGCSDTIREATGRGDRPSNRRGRR